MINCQPNCAASHHHESTEQGKSGEGDCAEIDGLQAECSWRLISAPYTR